MLLGVTTSHYCSLEVTRGDERLLEVISAQQMSLDVIRGH